MVYRRVTVFIKYIPANYLICFFLLSNIILRSVFLVAEPISHDEPFTLYFSGFHVSHIISYLSNYNNPPLFELLLHYWLKIFGHSFISNRSFPMLLTSCGVIYMIKICEMCFTRSVALLSAALFTFSNFTMWHTHDCRSYPLFMLLTLISFFYFFSLVKNNAAKLKQFSPYIIGTVLLLYSHYFGAIILSLQVFCFGIYYFNYRKQFANFILRFTICVAIYLPQFVTAVNRASYSAAKGTWIKPPNGLESVYDMLWTFSNKPVPTVICICIILVGAFVYIFRKNTKPKSVFVTFLILWFALPLFSLFFISYKVPVFIDRYLIFILPAYYMLIGICINFIFRKPAIKFLICCIVIACFFFTFNLNPSKKRKLIELTTFVEERKDVETAIVVCPFDFILTYAYYTDSNFFQIKDQSTPYDELIKRYRNRNIFFVNSISPQLTHQLSQFNKVIFMDAAAAFACPGNDIYKQLSCQYNLSQTHYFPEIFNVFEFKK